MSLSNLEKKRYRQIGHSLKPVVIVGQSGLSENVINEANSFLDNHELIKVKFLAEDRDERKKLMQELSFITQAEAVQIIGKIALYFKLAKNPNERLSKIRGAES